MDKNLRDQMNANIEDGKVETEATRAEVRARADDAKADITARAGEAQTDVEAHFEEVRGTAAGELDAADGAAETLGSSSDHEKEEAEDRLVQMLDKARERQDADDDKGFFDRIKGMFGSH